MTLKDPSNEICRCGHSQSDHHKSDSLVKFSGACKLCQNCIRYTFKSWAFDGKKINYFLGNKEISEVWK